MYDPLRAKAKTALSVAGCFLFGLALTSQFGFVEAPAPAIVIQTDPTVPDEAVQPALDLSQAFVNVADAVTPAVVMIKAERMQTRDRNSLDRFFRQQPQRGMPDIVEAGGSGFIVSDDGYVMTNNHVIENAERITVTLQDGRTFRAEVVGTDPTTDIAVIRIDGTGLPTASLGSSADVRVGEWVLAIGNPGFSRGGSPNLDYTVTAGIVSALGRSLRLINRSLFADPEFTGNAGFAIEDFIQTDAVINSGNSGGPMVNLRGQVIGINAAIVSNTGVYQGYGFAIPIDLAHRVMEDLVAYGRVKRAYLGVSIREVNAEDAEVLGLPAISGTFVESVTPGEPAARAGLRQYDVITGVDGEGVVSANDLQHKIALRAPGESVRLTVYRNGAAREVAVRLEEAPFSDDVQVVAAPEPRTADKIGIEVTEITPGIVQEFQLESTEGVAVSDVQAGGPAWSRNIRRGCVIRQIDRRAIRDTDDVRAAFAEVEPGDVVSLIAACPRADQGMVESMYNVRVPR